MLTIGENPICKRRNQWSIPQQKYQPNQSLAFLRQVITDTKNISGFTNNRSPATNKMGSELEKLTSGSKKAKVTGVHMLTSRGGEESWQLVPSRN